MGQISDQDLDQDRGNVDIGRQIYDDKKTRLRHDHSYHALRLPPTTTHHRQREIKLQQKDSVFTKLPRVIDAVVTGGDAQGTESEVPGFLWPFSFCHGCAGGASRFWGVPRSPGLSALALEVIDARHFGKDPEKQMFSELFSNFQRIFQILLIFENFDFSIFSGPYLDVVHKI